MDQWILKLILAITVSSYVVIPVHYAAAQDHGHIVIGAGQYNVSDDETESDYRLEYRSGDAGLLFDIRPYISGDVTSQGAHHLGAGLFKDFFLSDSVYVTPLLGIYYYQDGGSDLNLGNPVVFRSQFEFGYEFENAQRLSVGYSHYSNASLDDHNPGAEVATLYYHHPINLYAK